MKLFGKRRYSEGNPKEIEVENFGRMRCLSDWYTVDYFEFMVFMKTYKVCLYAICNGNEGGVLDKQVEACGIFLESKEKIQDLLQNALLGLMHGCEEKEIIEMLQIKGVYFAPDGSFGVSALLEGEDDELAKFDVGPDNGFGVVLFPDVILFHSSEEFFEHYGY